MQIVVLTVIMKTISNNKGIALVALIIAMTLISLMGASTVSIMGAKQRGFVFQVDSYRALNLANAGVEYAIRYVGDSIDPTGNNLNDFFHRPSIYTNIKLVSTLPDIANLGDTTQWKRFDFGNGQFYISYYLNPSDPDNSATNKMLYVVGVMKGTQKVIKLKKFLTYAAPASAAGLDRLNLVPNQQPYISGNYVVVPVMNLTVSDIVLSSIQFEADLTNNLTKEFTDIYIRSSQGSGGANIYNYFPGMYVPVCSATIPTPQAELPCAKSGFIEIPDSSAPHTGLKRTNPLNLSGSPTIPAFSIRWFSLRFNETGSNLNGIYTVTFNFAGGSSITRFSVP